MIENYTDGDPTTGNADEDRTVEFTYTPDGQRATITARQHDSNEDQTTVYAYGTTLDDSQIARSDLLRAKIYPDSDDSATGFQPVFFNGPDGVYDRIEYTYNRQGQRLSMKDQNGAVHQYEYNALGRSLHDRITTLALDVDGAVRRISTTYDVRGNLERATSYDNATVGSGNVVNEVLREYNDYGLLHREYQEHSGAKDGNTPYVGYNYDETALNGEVVNGLRPTSLRYPNGRLVHYTYGSTDSASDVLNRLNAINNDNIGSPGDVLASYTYLGLGTVVVQDYEQPDVKLDLFGGTSGVYAGLDRFDRVVEYRWHDDGTLEERLFALQDANWNLISIADPVATVQERYAYSAYGEVSFLTATWTIMGSSALDTSYVFTSRPRDPQTGIYDDRMRWYVPALALFSGRDPLGHTDASSLYQYCDSSPIIRVDARGMQSSQSDSEQRSSQECCFAAWRDPTIPKTDTTRGMVICCDGRWFAVLAFASQDRATRRTK